MIANLDFVGVLINIPGNHFVIGLLTLGDDIERIAYFDAHVLVLRGVVDAVFADELLIAFVVFLVKANRPGGKGHAEFVLLRVAELHVHADFFLDRLAGIVIAGVVVPLAV